MMMMSIHPTQSPGVSPNTPETNTPYYKTYPFLGGSAGIVVGVPLGMWRANHAPDVFVNRVKKSSETDDYTDITYALHYTDAQRSTPKYAVYSEELVKGHINDYGELTKQKYVARGSATYSVNEKTKNPKIVAPVQRLNADGSLQDVQPQVIEGVPTSQPNEWKVTRLQTFCPGHEFKYWEETGVLSKGRYTPQQILKVPTQSGAAPAVRIPTAVMQTPLPVSEKDLAHFFSTPADFLQRELRRTLEKQERSTWKAVLGWGATIGLVGFASGWGADLMSRHHRKHREASGKHEPK
jgi:hypothetical protein